MRLNKIVVLWVFLLMIRTTVLFSQQGAQYIYDGNNLYNSGLMPQSTSKYTKALELDPNNRKANFNLGNSLFKTAQLIKEGKMAIPANSKIKPDSLANMVFDQAAQNFAVVANSVSDKDTLHQAWHNIGNCFSQKKDYKQAVDAYKKSLKFDPKDEETRYNLAYALKHLPKEDKKGGGQSKQPQDKKEEKKNEKKPEQQNEMTKDQAEQLLKALMESEKKLQDKRKQKPEDASKSTQEKDW